MAGEIYKPMQYALLASIFVLLCLIFVYFGAEAALMGRRTTAVACVGVGLIALIFFAIVLAVVL